MRFTIATAALLATSLPLAAQQNSDPDRSVQGGQLPAGWHAVPDQARANMRSVRMVEENGGYRITLGPRVNFYRDSDRASGNYTLTASVTRLAEPAHPESYGVFFGGSNLDQETPTYVYFLLQGTQNFLIRKRTSGQLGDVTTGWMQNDAIRPGNAENTLSVQVGADRVRFLVNGTEVHSEPRSAFPTDGIWGIRVNHNLDVRVSSIGVTR